MATRSRAAMAQAAGWAPATLAVCALAFVGLGVSRIVYPYDVGQYEANAWAPASLLAHLHNPYSQSLSTSPPFVAAPYGPAYHAVVGVGVRLFGDQFWFARLISVIGGLLSAWLAFRIARRFNDDRFPPCLARRCSWPNIQCSPGPACNAQISWRSR